jgi:hypothetical protein
MPEKQAATRKCIDLAGESLFERRLLQAWRDGSVRSNWMVRGILARLLFIVQSEAEADPCWSSLSHHSIGHFLFAALLSAGDVQAYTPERVLAGWIPER